MISLIEKSREDIDKICQDSGITYLGIFGSQARGEQKPDSDIDLLVKFKTTPGLISFIHTKQEFEKIFRRKVDLITKNGVSKYLKPYIEKDLTQIYG